MKWEYMIINLQFAHASNNKIEQISNKHYNITGTHHFMAEKLDGVGEFEWEVITEHERRLILKRSK